LRDIGLAIQHSTSPQQAINKHRIFRGGFESKRRDPEAGIVTLDLECIFQGDRDAMERTERRLALLEMDIQFLCAF
jgi:hypothetical protein